MDPYRGPKYRLHIPIKQRTIDIIARLVSGESGGGADVKRTGETSGPQRIRQLGEKTPRPSQRDERLSLLPILTDKTSRTFSISVAVTTSGQSFTAGFEMRLKRLAERPPRKNVAYF